MSEPTRRRKRKQPNASEDEDRHVSTLKKYRSVVSKNEDIPDKPAADVEKADDSVPVPTAGLVPLPQPSAAKKIVAAVKETWMVTPTYVKHTQSKPFDSLGLSERMVKNLKQAGFVNSFAVQASVIPMLMADARDISPDIKGAILVNAATGSGKTLAYGIPIVEALSHRIVPRIRAVVVLPTKPLIQQVRAVLESLARGTSLRVTALRSDRPFADEQLLLQHSTPDIVITTPGRLVDHIRSTPGFTLEHLKYIVIDEADRLLNQSFQEWVDVLMDSLPDSASNQRKLLASHWSSHVQTLIFSATLTKDAGKWASLKLREPRVVIVGEKPRSGGSAQEDFSVPFTLQEYMVAIQDVSMKPLLLMNLLMSEAITGRCIIFTRSNETAARLARLLTILDDTNPDPNRIRYRIGLATGEIEQNMRKKALREFAAGSIDLIICTDIIARGIDIESTQHVMNYDIPISAREYVHRVGRTARAGKVGAAWSLVSRQEAKWFKSMVNSIKRGKDQKLLNRTVEVWDGQEALYESALSLLEKQVKGTSH